MTDPLDLASEMVTDPDPRVISFEVAPPSSQPTLETHSAGEEQALESHEVIELQTFSDRKAWIEEKIKFLESLPPIEIFAGLEGIKSSSENVSVLPNRLELQRWVAEHDAIEKETEIFDTGELTKLRQLTKAATQRNLSPEDTDVIELTLTTIYGLDKLLHLLRDRSENLEMMGIRLTWEENRQSSWKERRQIIEDLEAFCISRARWSPAIYDANLNLEDSHVLPRRSSIASLASAGSDNAINSPAFSRSARFKLAEVLARDAAQFTGRVTGLRHSKVTAAGKALDKLIDHSRKPVPEDLLDEQDRLEEKCINEMENISKFTMNLVMQWRKADEIHVETMKDQSAASNLLEEIETAKLYHPTARQSTSFASRIDTILKRLAVRGDPSSTASMFPRPEHFLFPDQKLSNDKLARGLSADIGNANRLARKVDLAAKDYRASYDAVKRVENMKMAIDDISLTLASILTKFKVGVFAEEGDGSPPDLTSERCLDPTSHSIFLAFLPSLLDSTKSAIDSANNLLRIAPSALLGLDRQGIDTQFKDHAASDVTRLSSLRTEVIEIRDSVSKLVVRLREARRISSEIDSKLTSVKELNMHIVESVKQEQWHQDCGGLDAPFPESPITPLALPHVTTLDLDSQLSQISSKLKVDIDDPLEMLSTSLEHELLTHLKDKVFNLQGVLEGSSHMLRLLGAIIEQTAAMKPIRDQFYKILSRIENSKAQIQSSIEAALNPPLDASGLETYTRSTDLEIIQQQVADFNSDLTQRVTFIAQYSIPPTNRGPSVKPGSPSSHLTKFAEFDMFAGLPLDLTSLDAGVRADSNHYSMRLNGGIEILKNEQKHLELVKISKSADTALSATHNELNAIIYELASQKSFFTTTPRDTIEGVNLLQTISNGVAVLKTKCSHIGQSLFPIRALLREMDKISDNLDPAIRESLYISRNDTANDAELRIKGWNDEANDFCYTISIALKNAQEYQEELKAAEERRRNEEESRLAFEEEERLRLEKERIQEEERRLLEEKLAEEHREELERQRREAKLGEQNRLAEEAAEAERVALEELERQAEVTRVQAENDRLLKEEAERIRLEQERAEMVKRLREAEARLQEERRLHSEREAAALDLERQMQLQMDLERKQQETQRLVEEQAHQRELEELLKQQTAEMHRLAEEEVRRTKEMEELERQRVTESQRIAEEIERQLEQELARQRQAKQQRIAEEKARQAELDELAKTEATRLAEEKHQLRLDEIMKQQQAEEQRLTEEQTHQAEAKQLESKKRSEERVPQSQSEDLANLRQAAEKTPNGKQSRHPEHEKFERQKRVGIQRPIEETHQVEVTLIKKPEKTKQKEMHQPNPIDGQDVFGNHATPNLSNSYPRSQELIELHAQLVALRKRLRSIGINEAWRPSKSSTNLPTETQFKKMHRDLLAISADLQRLPSSTDDTNINTELKSMKADVEDGFISLKEVEKLVGLHEAVQACDAALSDLLEHIDSYPAAPLCILSSPHRSIPIAPPEEQLSSRLDFTRRVVEEMATKSTSIIDDSRTRSEHSRIQQTWVELEEMANDRINGNKSRPSSAVSRNSSRSGRNSNASILIPHLPTQSRAKKKGSYSNLSVSSVSSPSKGKMLAPPLSQPKSRRTASGANETVSRSTSRLSSISSNRSVSGPLSTSLHGSTFASRQRTTSLTSSIATPARPPSLSASRFRIASENKRSHSPSMSEKSAHSRSSLAPSRSSINSSTWSRAPRNSLSSILQHSRVVTPPKKTDSHIRKKYVANPKSKLDIAVGDVVNQLPVGINIEGITESWRDQSGKYWIGNQDPKLCFCRILRSQTVMVRVGGGWTELSKFIKDHFADSFRIAPDSPRMGAQERWISSATLLESQETLGSPPRAPQTPEPTLPFVPSFSLMTPSGQSPHSLRSSSSAKGSPLTPLQFMRRAEPEHSTNLLRPVTPSKTPLRGRTSNANTPAPVRTSIWRP